MKFKDAYRSANDTVHVRAELLDEMKSEQANEHVKAVRKRESRRAWWVAIPTTAAAAAVACIAVFVGLRAGHSKAAAPSAVSDVRENAFSVSAEEAVTDERKTADAGALKVYDTYDSIAEQLRQRVTDVRKSSLPYDTAEADGFIIEAPTAAEPDVVSESAGLASFNGITYTMDEQFDPDETISEYGTNVQVQGVDEADIVKTDGQWIYCLNRSKNRLYVVSAEGASSVVTASAELSKPKANDSIEYSEMILSNDRLYVIGTQYDWSTISKHEQMTFIDVYALGDRTSLKKIDTLNQDGVYNTARLIGDTLVIVSGRTFWFAFEKNTEIDTWCPSITADGESTLLEPEDIYINEDSDGSGYVMITTVDTETGARFDSHKAVFGGNDVVYCNKTHLLLASGEWEHTRSEEQTDENGKHFVTDLSKGYTSLCLFDIADGRIEPIATQKIEGTLLNQFSMDAYNDTYRMVVTRSGHEETIWTDGIDTYEYKSIEGCALYVLDRGLEPIGRLENVAEGETVQSVRFMGNTAYFVTFRQVDPLFAVDLSDPTLPTILSALKIPGFSAYLHPFGEGRLIGIGYSADEQTGITDGVKLTLFDISDPSNVKVLQTKKVNASYTMVQYNHKAVFADTEKGVLAFPADERYYVFSVGDDGLTEIGSIRMGDGYWDETARGVAIGDYFYVVTSEAVAVLSFDSIRKLAEVTF